MFRKKPKSKQSFIFPQSMNRGSDIVRPDNTSLIVNDSDTESDPLPKELTSILSEDDSDEDDSDRKTSSLMKSLSQKTQSTPLRPLTSQNVIRVEKKKLSYFEEVLKSCGATPLSGNSSYTMAVDQAVFSVKLNKKLKENEENLQQFISSFEKEIDNSETLKKMLAHTLTAEDCSVARGPVQEPLMRMLLNVDSLQTEIIELLLTKLASIVIDGITEELQIISSILRQMRFLNKVKDVKISSKLFEIIHVAPLNVQREVIFFLPEVISEKETEETSIQLLELLKCDVKLTQVVIDALTNLPLDKEVRSRVRSKILNRLDKSTYEFLPSLVQFALNKCNEEILSEVINGLRENLPFTPQHFQIRKSSQSKKNSEDDSYIKLTFENLKFSAMASKNTACAWIKIISNLNSSAEFRCVDFVMLIIFYSCLFGRKSEIRNLIRNKVKLGVLNQTIVQNTFQTMLVVVVEYFSTILELASTLLKSIEEIVSEFGSLLYKECFTHFNPYMKQTVVNEILLHIGTGSPGVINCALTILKELSETQKEALCQYTMIIMRLLIKVPDLDLTQVRLLINVIAELVFSKFDSSRSGWQDELQIFTRKQLVSSKLEQCKKGIVTAIILAKHAGKKKEIEEVDHSHINSLLELAMGSDGTSDTKRAFFNDEFATMLKESKLSGLFLSSWNEKFVKLVKDNLFVQNIDVECPDFPMFLQYSLDPDGDQKLVFPIVVFIVNSHSNKTLNIPVPVIPSTLRLLWCSERNFNKILPIFSASVIMPESIVYDNFITFDESQKKKILDCLFLCANFLVECINALCSYKMVDKALLRIKQLTKVRKLLAGHINFLPNYVPNLCQFYAPLQKIIKKKSAENKKKGKKGRKRKLEESLSETSNFSIEESQVPEAPTVIEVNNQPDLISEEADLHMYSGYFRELNWEARKLLEMDLDQNLKKDFFAMDMELDEGNSEKSGLQASDVLLLFEDFIHKSEQILKNTKRLHHLKTKASCHLLESVSSTEFVEATIQILPNILVMLEAFSKYCKNLIEANDGVYDAKGMYPQEAADIKLAFAVGLKLVAEIISWKGFQNSNNKLLLRDILIILSKKYREENSSMPSISSVALEAANYLVEFKDSVLIFNGGYNIVKAFQTCLTYASSKDLNSLAELCYELFCRNWYSITGAPEKGLIFNQNLDFMLKTYFSCIDNKLEVVRNTAKIALSEVEELGDKNSTMNTFKTINKTNFPLLYRGLCEALVSASTEEFSKKKNDEHFLNVWSVVVEILLVLVDIAKIHSSRANLASLLKRSQSIIQLFMSKGLPIAQAALRVKTAEVLAVLKSLQTVTRFLHSICCHSKINNDSVLASHAPAIRSLCDRLTIEVKALLTYNNIPTDCIIIAVLKNRDLKGNDIISQETLDQYSDDESELPPEDTPQGEEEREEEEED